MTGTQGASASSRTVTAMGVTCAFLAASVGGAAPPGPGLQPVEPGVADLGPLSLSQRVMPLDLRVSGGFEGVVRLEGGDRRGGSGRRGVRQFARIQGGIVAVFPRSVYERHGGMLVPVIPPGTVFHVGVPLTDAGASGSAGLSGRSVSGAAVPSRNAVDHSVSLRAEMAVQDYDRAARGDGDEGPRPAEGTASGETTEVVAVSASRRAGSPWPGRARERPALEPALFTDPEYRARRVRRLLEQAAGSP